MKYGRWEIKRREFLKHLGVGAAMLPMLGEARTFANPGTSPTRFIVMVKGNGVRVETFWPTWPQRRPPDGSLATAKLPHVTAAFEPFKERMLMIDGITLRNWLREEGNPTGGNGDAHHNWGSLLTGELPSDVLVTHGGCGINATPRGCRMQGGSASLDCWIGQQLRKTDSGIQHDSISLSINSDRLFAARSNGGLTCVSWLGRDKPNVQEPDPAVAYAKLFGGELPDPQQRGPSSRTRQRLRLMDAVGKDLERFVKNLGASDRLLAEAHLESVRAYETRIAKLGAGGPTCSKGTAPAVKYKEFGEEEIPAQTKVMLDMMVDSLKCGVARTAAFSFWDSNGYTAFFTWLKHINPNFRTGVTPDKRLGGFPDWHIHAMAHGNGEEPAKTMYRDMNRWTADQVAYVAQRLLDEPEGDGTMLDNTIILYADTLSDGGGHSVRRLPWLLIGNANRYFRTGRHVDVNVNGPSYRDDTAPNGLFVAIAEAMGVPPPDGVFGNPKFGKGPMTVLRA